MQGIRMSPEIVVPGVYDLDYYVAAYDGEVMFTDREVGRLVRSARVACGGESPITVFTADHGESFAEHGIFGHGMELYDESIAIPLILHHETLFSPGARPGGLVETVDILPTVLELAGLSIPGGIDGQSLVPLLQGREAEPSVERERELVQAEVLLAAAVRRVHDPGRRVGVHSLVQPGFFELVGGHHALPVLMAELVDRHALRPAPSDNRGGVLGRSGPEGANHWVPDVMKVGYSMPPEPPAFQAGSTRVMVG